MAVIEDDFYCVVTDGFYGTDVDVFLVGDQLGVAVTMHFCRGRVDSEHLAAELILLTIVETDF